MKITPRIAMEIIHHEALIREAYKDSVGVWTWSVGITSASGHKVERYIDNPQSIEKCLNVYIWLLENRYAPAVRQVFRGHNLSENQFAAALSFHWNTGSIKKASWVKRFKAGDVEGAKRAFMNYRKPKEIIPRRKAERDLFFSGKWAGHGFVTIYPITRRHTPFWRQGKRVNIEKDLLAVLSPVSAPIPDHVPTAPKEQKSPQKPVSGKPTILALAVGAFLSAVYGSWDWITSLF